MDPAFVKFPSTTWDSASSQRTSLGRGVKGEDAVAYSGAVAAQLPLNNNQSISNIRFKRFFRTHFKHVSLIFSENFANLLQSGLYARFIPMSCWVVILRTHEGVGQVLLLRNPRCNVVWVDVRGRLSR